MDVDVPFPLFVFQKDDYSMFLIDTPDKLLHHMEPIDIKNGEYLFWDANGRAVHISIAGQRITGICYCEAEISLGEALMRHSEVYGLGVDTVGPPHQVRAHLNGAEVRLKRSGSGLLSKLFKRGST
jgi:hypothetical protein